MDRRPSRRAAPAPVAAVLVALALLAGARPAAGQIMVIAHPSVTETNVSLDALRRLFLGSTQTWRGTTIPVRLSECAVHRKAFYRTVLGMAESQFDRHWVGLQFQGGDVSPPQRFPTPREVARFVAETPGAIGFVDPASLSSAVKVLRVEGLLPNQRGYPIQ